MNKSLKNTQITIKPELAELDGYVIFAKQIAQAQALLARVGLPDLEKIKKMQKEKEAK